MDPTAVTLDDALKFICRLPGGVNTRGRRADHGAERPVRPLPHHGKDSRSLPDEPSIFNCTVEQALELFAQPKRGRGRQEPQPGKGDRQ